jgi:hypothetical protein
MFGSFDRASFTFDYDLLLMALAIGDDRRKSGRNFRAKRIRYGTRVIFGESHRRMTVTSYLGGIDLIPRTVFPARNSYLPS